MATQHLTVATFAGESAVAVTDLFRLLRTDYDLAAVDRFCATLRDNGRSLPVVYFCEWVDRWLMGDLVPGPDAAEGRKYQATCLSPEQAIAWAERCGHQFPEQEWLAARFGDDWSGRVDDLGRRREAWRADRVPAEEISRKTRAIAAAWLA